MAQADIIRGILASSLKKSLEKESIEKVTIEQICEHATISRTSFYRYFQDKYELLTWIIESEFFQSLVSTPEKAIWDYYPAFIQYIYVSRRFLKNALTFEGQNSLRKYLLDRWAPIIVNDFQNAFSSKEWETFFVEWYVKMSQEAYLDWLGQKEMIPPEEFLSQHIEAFKEFFVAVQNSFDKYHQRENN